MKLKNQIRLNLYKLSGKLQKRSPEILLGVGIVGGVASGVMACKATLKLPTILNDAKDTVDLIKQTREKEEYAELYTAEDETRDLSITYIQTGLKVAKLYALPVALGSASICCLLTSNNIMRKRNIALSAAYLTIDKSFKEYRNRVSERFGEQIEREIRYDIKAKEIEVKKVAEDGTETIETEVVNVAHSYSDYAKFFDESCTAWQKDPEYNLMFLKSQQQYANDLLVAKGRLFLNDVYDMLGIDRTKAGQVVGWIYDPKNPVGDNYVDFGIYDMSKERVRAFVNGYEPNILLDFNVDGNILDLM